MPVLPDSAALRESLHQHGYAFPDSGVMERLLGGFEALADWADFAGSWDDLAPDTYLSAVGRHRRRRHATFSVDNAGQVQRLVAQPHVQSLVHNPLQGNIRRWFQAIRPVIADGASMRRILAFSWALFAPLAPRIRRWHVETHQFRIEARLDEAGEPTPEGVHHDGVDYVLVLLIDRENIEKGTTTIHDADGSLLGSFTLTRPLDAALVEDVRVAHGVTPVTPLDPTRPAHRDVLVVTFRASDQAQH